MKSITIRKARVHNLKNIDLTIPKDKLIVVTGVSGSGKSSLVFDILFEEGRRRYLQSIGVLTSIAEEDRFESVTGIGPTVAVQQNLIRQSNPRSVVGTKTGLLAYLCTLYVNAGEMACSACGKILGSAGVCSCGNEVERLTTPYFSFNSPSGMCLKCEGRGHCFELNLKKLIPDTHMTLRQVLGQAGALTSFQYLLTGRLEAYADKPFGEMPREAQEHILYGVSVRHGYPSKSLFGYLRWKLSRGKDVGDTIEMVVCPECQGYRVGEEARRVTIQGRHIGHLGQMTLLELATFLDDWAARKPLPPFEANLVQEMLRKTNLLIQAGLGHLSLYREMPSLSGGEVQRLFLTSHLDYQMDSLIYILDEPTIGLHEIEKAGLLKQVADLRAIGNTVIIVEHDKNSMAEADHIIDIGPLAGIGGGEVVYQGTYAGLLQSSRSITGQYLSGQQAVPSKASGDYASITEATPGLIMRQVRTNNLKGITVKLPLGVMVGIAGVSGSGKSSLITDTLVPLLASHFVDRREKKNPAEEDGVALVKPPPIAAQLEGVEYIAGYAEISQAPIGRHHNSHPASYLNIWDSIRKLFAQQPLARQRAYTPGHFSFNSDGACPDCHGSGYIKTWLGGNFFVSNRCVTCQGRRYQEEILAVTCQGKNILDVLNLNVSEAVGFFQEHKAIYAMLKVLDRIGMGYLTLGQSTPTLSGGEAQRIKLAKEIGRRRSGNILYVLDEPTTGLSLYDTAKLLALLDELVKQGNSVIVVEHDPAVLSYCDWIIELGFGGGNEGGEMIAQGSPLDLKQNPYSRIGPFLSAPGQQG